MTAQSVRACRSPLSNSTSHADVWWAILGKGIMEHPAVLEAWAGFPWLLPIHLVCNGQRPLDWPLSHTTCAYSRPQQFDLHDRTKVEEWWWASRKRISLIQSPQWSTWATRRKNEDARLFYRHIQFQKGKAPLCLPGRELTKYAHEGEFKTKHSLFNPKDWVLIGQPPLW